MFLQEVVEIVKEMPSVPAMIATVAIVVVFIKTLLAKINVLVEGAGSIVVAVLSSIGVWGYHMIDTGTAFTMAGLLILAEVAIGATMGYKLLPDSIKKFDLVNLRGEILNGK